MAHIPTTVIADAVSVKPCEIRGRRGAIVSVDHHDGVTEVVLTPDLCQMLAAHLDDNVVRTRLP